MNPKRKRIFTVLFFAFIGITGLFVLRNMYISYRHLGWGSDAQTDETVIKNLPAQAMYLLPSYTLSAVTGKHYYPENKIWICQDGQMMSSAPERNMIESAISVYSLYWESRRIRKNFLFVLCPGKPMEDEILTDYGFDASSNRNADELLRLLDEMGVPYLDLRPVFREKMAGDISKYFYRTDHHWNASGGLMAASCIAEELNKRYDMQLETELLQEEYYTKIVYPKTWIGESGQKTIGFLAGTEDFEILWPDFEHELAYVDRTQRVDTEGSLDILFNKASLSEDHTGSARSMYYSYMYANNSKVSITNLYDFDGNILMIKDSLSNTCVPYLALSCGQVTTWDVRVNSTVDLYTYMEDMPYVDTVVVCYQHEVASAEHMYRFRRGRKSLVKKARRWGTGDAEEALTEGLEEAETEGVL